MCKLGFDIKLEDMNQNEHLYCDQAVKNYNRLKPVILEGDLYRLVSPYGSNHTSSMFVGKDKKNGCGIRLRYPSALCGKDTACPPARVECRQEVPCEGNQYDAR